MLEFESLAMADAYEWLGTGEMAGEFLLVNQSTISRNQSRFQALNKQLKEAKCVDLMSMERAIHQKWRFEKGHDLRLHTFQWTNHLMKQQHLGGWKMNPYTVSTTKKPLLDLLERRVIDGACAPYPLIASADSNTFAFLPLYRSCLQVLTDAGSNLALDRCLSAGDISAMTVPKKLLFVPKEAAHCSAEIDAMQFASHGESKVSSSIAPRYWGIPLTTLVMPNLRALDYDTSIPYEEHLVVLKEWAGHPRIISLWGKLTDSLRSTLGRFQISGLVDLNA